jgi:hypothetical protein
MRITKSIFLSFSTSSTTAYINVNFDVSHMHCRSISYQRGGTTSSTPKYGVLLSDLTENEPLGIFYNDSAYSTAPGLNSIHEFQGKKKISGFYNFTMLYADGTPLSPVNTPDYIVLLLEFTDESSKFE